MIYMYMYTDGYTQMHVLHSEATTPTLRDREGYWDQIITMSIYMSVLINIGYSAVWACLL